MTYRGHIESIPSAPGKANTPVDVGVAVFEVVLVVALVLVVEVALLVVVDEAGFVVVDVLAVPGTHCE
jgi:hypothetical protein